MDSVHKCQQQSLDRHDATSSLDKLQQQKKELLKQHEHLSARNSAVVTEAYKNNTEQKIRRIELLGQKSDLDDEFVDIERCNEELNDCKTKTNKAFDRSKSFMMLQLEQVTAENKEAVEEEAIRNEELKIINERLFNQLDKLTAENAQLALECARSNEQLLSENELLLHQSDRLAHRIIDANKILKKKEEQISKQLKELATRASASVQNLTEQVAQRNDRHEEQSRKRGAHDVLRENTDENTFDTMEEYTKCCVCLERYEVDSTTSREKRLPIKSATCTHTLCELCVDNCFASILASGKSKVRYVTCPQCRTKRAFDVQNKVVDSFLKEYMIHRCTVASKRTRIKPNESPITVSDDSVEESRTNSSEDNNSTSTTKSLLSGQKKNADNTVKVQACFRLMFEGAVEKHKSRTIDIFTRSVGEFERKVPFEEIEKAREEARGMIYHANTFIFEHGGIPCSEEVTSAALSKAENEARQTCKQQKEVFMSLYRRASSAVMQRVVDKNVAVDDNTLRKGI